MNSLHILFKKLILLLLLSSIQVFSQVKETKEAELHGMVKRMFNDMNNRDYDAILEMTHPKVFEMVPKEQMKELLKSMFEGNEEFIIDIPKTAPEYKLSKVYKGKKNDLQYAFTSYDLKMKMTFKNQEFDKESKEVMKSIMATQGMDVTFISNNAVDVFMTDRITILLKDIDTKSKWVMLNYDPDSPMFYKILSSEVLEAAKEYKQNLMLARKKNSEE